jgi:hypothetical protein
MCSKGAIIRLLLRVLACSIFRFITLMVGAISIDGYWACFQRTKNSSSTANSLVPNAANTTEQGPPLQKATHNTEKRNIIDCFGKYRTFQASLLQLMMMQSECLRGRQATSNSASSLGQSSFCLNGTRVLV